jgi:hypothetical protein
MKLFAAIIFAILCSLASASTTYGDVSEYLDVVTLGATEKYSCVVSSHYLEHHTCKVIGAPKYSAPRVFGLIESKIDETAFLFVLKSDTTRQLHLEAQSSLFPLPRDVSVETIETLDNEAFTLQLNSGVMAAPVVSVYQFKLAKGEWRLAKLERTSLGSCGAETGVVSRYSTNFMLGTIRLDRYQPEDCKLATTQKNRLKFKAFPLSNFTPFDDKYEPPAQP